MDENTTTPPKSPPQPGTIVPTPAVTPTEPAPAPVPATPIESTPTPVPEINLSPTAPAEPTPPQSLAMDTDEGPVFSWQASEYMHHEKPFVWYVGFAVVVVALVAAAVVTQQWLSIGVFAAMAIALMVYANKAPRTLSYRLDGNGVTIGDKFYSYDRFRSYAILRDVGWHAVDLEPTQRFMPRLTIMFDDADLDQIEALLSAQLPKVERQPDWVERLSRYLKF